MPTLREQLKPILAAMGMADGQQAALFNADGSEFTTEAPNLLLQHDATRITKVKTDSKAEGKTEGFNEGHQKGTKDSAEKLEKELREEHGVDSDKKGKELFSAIIDKYKTQKAPELEEDKVKLHPAYVKMESDLKKQIKQVQDEATTKFEERDKQLAKEAMFAKVLSRAKEEVTGLKPILPSDQKKAEKQMELLVQDLAGFEFTMNADGTDFIISKDGKPYNDPHGNRIDFKTLVKTTSSSIWDFQEGEERSSGANSNDVKNNGKQTNQTITVPKNDKEYMDMIAKETDPDKRIAIDDAYTKSQSSEGTK